MDIFGLVVLCAALGFVSTTAWAVTLAAFFIVGSAGFWGMLALCSIGVLVALEYEHELSAFLSVLAMGLILQLYSGVSIVGYVIHNPSSIFYLGAFYLVLGTAWSFFKWYLHCRDERKRFDEWIEEEKKGTQRYGPGSRPEKPLASVNKARITGWMTFWPWSLVWFIINDPVRRAFNAIYDRLQGIYQRISDSAFAGVDTE